MNGLKNSRIAACPSDAQFRFWSEAVTQDLPINVASGVTASIALQARHVRF